MFVNPLVEDKYYQRIMKQADQQLNRFLVESLST